MEIARIQCDETTPLTTAPLVKVSHVQVLSRWGVGSVLAKGLDTGRCEQLWPLMALCIVKIDLTVRFYL